MDQIITPDLMPSWNLSQSLPSPMQGRRNPLPTSKQARVFFSKFPRVVIAFNPVEEYVWVKLDHFPMEGWKKNETTANVTATSSQKTPPECPRRRERLRLDMADFAKSSGLQPEGERICRGVRGQLFVVCYFFSVETMCISIVYAALKWSMSVNHMMIYEYMMY